MINILMIDEVSSIKGFSEFLNSKSSTQVNIKYKCSDGLEGIEVIKNHLDEIDCIVLSLVLPSLDGVGILKYLKREHINKRVILYTYNTNLDLLKLLGEYSILFVLYKGMDLNLLEDRIADVGTLKKKDMVEEKRPLQEMTKEISRLLHDLGMPSHIKGYQYIRDSIELMYNNPNVLGGITKEVYPFIADKYNTTPSRVERAIRHAIEVSWTRGDYDLMEEIFGHSVDFDRAKPTNSEFLATIADKLSIESKSNNNI